MMSQHAPQAKYIYCIVRAAGSRSFGKIGIGAPSSNVYTTTFKNLGVVVSDTPFIRYEPNEENALAHERVVEKVMEHQTVLPARFGTIFKDEKNVRNMLVRLYSQFLSELRRLDGKVEVGLKVFWEPQDAIREVEKNPAIHNLEQAITSQSRGLAYLMRKKLDENIRTELNRKADAYSDLIFRTLRKQAIAAKLLKPIGHMILNGAFLIHKGRMQDFGDEVKKLQGQLQAKALGFHLSGPWPPYNFVTIRYQ